MIRAIKCPACGKWRSIDDAANPFVRQGVHYCSRQCWKEKPWTAEEREEFHKNAFTMISPMMEKTIRGIQLRKKGGRR